MYNIIIVQAAHIRLLREDLGKVICFDDEDITQCLKVLKEFIQKRILQKHEHSKEVHKRMTNHSKLIKNTVLPRFNTHLEIFDDSSIFIHITNYDHSTCANVR